MLWAGPNRRSSVTSATVTDLLEATAALVAVPSESHHEAALADVVERRLRRARHLTVDRLGDNVVARTTGGQPTRLVVAGHLDTVPADGNAVPRIEGDRLWGRGAADMKGGLAIMLDLATRVAEPALEVTWAFYVAEEVEAVHNGLGHLFAHRPELVSGDAALLAEPTGAVLELGCQGTLRLEVRLRGVRAHTARPWTGRNAVHRAGHLLAAVDRYEPRRPVLDGCEYHEALQAVAVHGGVSGNVVPDLATVTLNHRFAPDRTAEEARAHVHQVLAPHLEDGDDVVVVDAAGGAPPGLSHPLLAALRARAGLAVRAKLGWTDVSRFAAAGIPAANLGPGDPLVAHTREEHVDRSSLERVHAALAGALRGGEAVRGAATR